MVEDKPTYYADGHGQEGRVKTPGLVCEGRGFSVIASSGNFGGSFVVVGEL